MVMLVQHFFWFVFNSFKKYQCFDTFDKLMMLYLFVSYCDLLLTSLSSLFMTVTVKAVPISVNKFGNFQLPSPFSSLSTQQRAVSNGRLRDINKMIVKKIIIMGQVLKWNYLKMNEVKCKMKLDADSLLHIKFKWLKWAKVTFSAHWEQQRCEI